MVEGLPFSEQRDEVLQLPFVPFSEAFPACAAVIYHGGTPTIAQCLRAGVPSLVVPGGIDQPFNAAQVVQLKAGCGFHESIIR
jgi:UDP:flavonoid glycosyltransferase YjiC (YdhE family)